MAYTNLQQLIDRTSEAMLVSLSDRADPATGVVDLDVINRALVDADALIDGFLAGRYALPLVSTPAVLSDLAGAIALYKLHTSDPEAKIKADYDHAMKVLAQIGRGDFRLTDVAGLAATSTAASGVQITETERPFTAENMKGFI